ncbi:MAG: hypothetical protein ABSB49_03155 [Polyangia bacterium]
MTPVPELNVSAIRSLLAVEREMTPQPEEVRQRALRRARAALASAQLGYPLTRTRLPRTRVVRVAAAAVMLVGLCAAAFEAGYRIKDRIATAAGAPATGPSPVLAETEGADPQGTALPISAGADPSALAPKSESPGQTPAQIDDAAGLAAKTEELELQVLKPALDAVARRDFDAALAAISLHQRRFPSGQLAEEREGLRVKALVGLGRATEARSAEVAFRERFPHSTLLSQITDQITEMMGGQR